jgi:phosphate-selective porin
VDLETLAGRARRLLAPELVDEAIGGDTLVRVEDEQREQRGGLSAAQVQGPLSGQDLEAAEDAKAVIGGRGRERRLNLAAS